MCVVVVVWSVFDKVVICIDGSLCVDVVVCWEVVGVVIVVCCIVDYGIGWIVFVCWVGEDIVGGGWDYFIGVEEG